VRVLTLKERIAMVDRAIGEQWVTNVTSLDVSTADRWLSSADPFSDSAINDLQQAIVADHFIVAATLLRGGVPLSLVFQLRKTVRLAGQRLRDAYEARGALGELAHRLPSRRIKLAPLTDYPIISERGDGPMSFEEALASARTHARWSKCPVIFTCDGSSFSRA
jgi:hypothetical protein